MHALKILSIEWKLFSYNSILHSPDISTNLIPKKKISRIPRSLINAFPWLLYGSIAIISTVKGSTYLTVLKYLSIFGLFPHCSWFGHYAEISWLFFNIRWCDRIRTGRISKLTVAHFSIPSGRRAASMIPQHFNRFQP